MPSKYQLHVVRWLDCSACDLYSDRRNVVLARGQLPCDVLFVGEAPGKSEDSLGQPFVGPAGQLLDFIVERSCGSTALCPECRAALVGGAAGIFCTRGHEFSSANCGVPVRVAFTNLIACIPLDEEDGQKISEPPDWAIEACQYRLQEFIEIANPQLLVKIGRHADDYLTPGYRHSIPLHRDMAQCSVQHPAYFLRLSTVQRDLGVQRCIVAIKNSLKDLGKIAESKSV